jgi:DHA2 family multidrug resistance protein
VRIQRPQFRGGRLLIALFGAVIYGIVTILPLFCQTLLDYSASAAGLAVSPRGLGAVLVMPIVGPLSNRLDNRWIMMCGFGLFAITTAWMGHLTLQISPWSLVWAIVLSGSAAGMVFVPLSTTAMGTLANEQIGNGSGLFNLLRNVGGSVGISVVDTLIARRQQVHRAELSRYTSPSPVFQHAYHTYYGQMAQHSGPHAAMLRAYGLIENGLNQQAVIYSYVDDLRYMVVVCLVCIPLLFLLKKVKAKGPVGAH